MMRLGTGTGTGTGGGSFQSGGGRGGFLGLGYLVVDHQDCDNGPRPEYSTANPPANQITANRLDTIPEDLAKRLRLIS